MKILLQRVLIISPDSPHHRQVTDILIENGIIQKLGKDLTVDRARVIQAANLHVSPGWVDLFAHFCDPGEEFKEDLESGAAAAAAGGFTEVLILPNTHPSLQSKSQIEYVIRKNQGHAVGIHPIGALSRDLKGESLAEMYEMHMSGAAAFSDGLHPVQSAGLLLKALQYVKAFDGVIVQLPDEATISRFGLMNEGVQSTLLGMPGKPALAEKLLIKRDLDLLRYTESRLHISGLTLESSVRLVQEAARQGSQASCSVTPYHLLLDDSMLGTYDSLYKVNPPLRNFEQVASLRQAVMAGQVDCFASHHLPQLWDDKQKEFEYALDGMIGLETAFGAIGIALPELDLDLRIRMLSHNPRRIFGLPLPEIREGAEANLTLFDPALDWQMRASELRSRSANTPLLDRPLKGKALGIIRNGQYLGVHN